MSRELCAVCGRILEDRAHQVMPPADGWHAYIGPDTAARMIARRYSHDAARMLASAEMLGRYVREARA